MNSQLLECAGKNSPFFPSFNDLRIFGGGQGGISHFLQSFHAAGSLCILQPVLDPLVGL